MHNELKCPVAKSSTEKYLSPYQGWQLETYGNILPQFHSINTPHHSTWPERQAELQLINLEINYVTT